MPRHFPRAAHSAALVAALITILACASDTLVYREPAPTLSAPDAAAGFVGYSDTAAKQTVCGNCHVDVQAQWATTAHANAWASLQASGHAGSTCEACHSVSSLGNAVTSANVAYGATKDARYRDVQCESCHGPGLTHASAPSVTNRPLASIAVDTGTKNTNGCGECHTGIHEPFVEEWRASAHGRVPNQLSLIGNTDPTCVGCHVGQGALQRFGVNANYVEKSSTAPQPLTCTVCHDPHGGNGIDKQLRLSVSTPNVDNNLCMKCHQRRAVPDQPNYGRNSPHSPEGETMLGYAGWFPPAMNVPAGTNVVATHGSDKNPKLCAGCHVNRWAVNDSKTGSLSFQVTGHRFDATPCADATGLPTGKTDCPDSQRAFKGCVGSGCHGSESVARSAFKTAEERIASLTLQVDAMVTKVPKTEIAASDGRYTSAEGAQFNSALAKKAGASAHNPFLIEQLLTASIKQMQTDYKLSVAPGLALDNILPRHK